ncbi:hypothetical protein VKT23_013290 [Stygiomarasmius scandens]|uniref:Uncharacterized protein n=1 Tax=Marasmiellus scandens TaxID=2682957 RepID=A0ABR1J5C2_9AGAR
MTYGIHWKFVDGSSRENKDQRSELETLEDGDVILDDDNLDSSLADAPPPGPAIIEDNAEL